MPINPGHSKVPVRSMAAESRQGNTCWGSAYVLLNSASGRSNANMARSVKVVDPSTVSLSDYRVNTGYTATVPPKCVHPSMKKPCQI